jgi:hypothetical protein
VSGASPTYLPTNQFAAKVAEPPTKAFGETAAVIAAEI